MQQSQFNIIPITPVSNTLTCSFFGDKIPKGASIKWDKLVDELPEGRAADKQSYYSDFATTEGAVKNILRIELKTQEVLLPIHNAILLSYMQMLGKPKSVLINFLCAYIF